MADGTTYPGSVRHPTIDEGLSQLAAATWREALLSHAGGAYTASALMCRKLLMHIAVDRAEANEGLRFVQYIDALIDSNTLPAPLQPALDGVRTAGNRATHELESIEREECERLLDLVYRALDVVYVLPSKFDAGGGSDDHPSVNSD